jgi:hypothetical protein
MTHSFSNPFYRNLGTLSHLSVALHIGHTNLPVRSHQSAADMRSSNHIGSSFFDHFLIEPSSNGIISGVS